jgi:hypothetical protein
VDVTTTEKDELRNVVVGNVVNSSENILKVTRGGKILFVCPLQAISTKQGSNPIKEIKFKKKEIWYVVI